MVGCVQLKKNVKRVSATLTLLLNSVNDGMKVVSDLEDFCVLKSILYMT